MASLSNPQPSGDRLAIGPLGQCSLWHEHDSGPAIADMVNAYEGSTNIGFRTGQAPADGLALSFNVLRLTWTRAEGHGDRDLRFDFLKVTDEGTKSEVVKGLFHIRLPDPARPELVRALASDVLECIRTQDIGRLVLTYPDTTITMPAHGTSLPRAVLVELFSHQQARDRLPKSPSDGRSDLSQESMPRN